MESGDYRGSSWISISRDSLENSQSLGHINIYPRSPYSPVMIYSLFFLLLNDYYFISFTYPKFFPTLYFFKDSYDQDLSSLEHSGGIILFILFFSVCLIYIYCSQDPTTNSELVLKFRIRRFGISCWIRWARYLFIGTAFLLESVQDFLIKLEMKPCLHLVEI